MSSGEYEALKSGGPKEEVKILDKAAAVQEAQELKVEHNSQSNTANLAKHVHRFMVLFALNGLILDCRIKGNSESQKYYTCSWDENRYIVNWNNAVNQHLTDGEIERMAWDIAFAMILKHEEIALYDCGDDNYDYFSNGLVNRFLALHEDLDKPCLGVTSLFRQYGVCGWIILRNSGGENIYDFKDVYGTEGCLMDMSRRVITFNWEEKEHLRTEVVLAAIYNILFDPLLINEPAGIPVFKPTFKKEDAAYRSFLAEVIWNAEAEVLNNTEDREANH